MNRTHADRLVALILAAGLAIQVLVVDPGAGHLLAVLVMAVALAWRRTAAVPCAGVVLVAMLAYPRSTDLALVLVPFAVAMYSAGAYAPLVPASVTAVGSGLVLTVTDAEDITSVTQFVGNLAFFLVLGGSLVGAGQIVRANRARAGDLTVLAENLARERDERARRAVEEERGRIARELHDVVAHAIGVVAVQAGAARATLAADTKRTETALDHIEDAAHQAGAEMRRLLGLLRDDNGPPELLPSLSRADALLDAARADGIDVRLVRIGDDRDLPPGVDVAAYRILQEALTNIRKHAPGARADIEVRFDPDAIHLTVSDGGAAGGMRPPASVLTAGPSHGLVGMRERVALYGGTFDAGPHTGGFRVRASLPTT